MTHARRVPNPGAAMIFDGNTYSPGGGIGQPAPGGNFDGNALGGVQTGLACTAGNIGEVQESTISTPTSAAATTVYLALTSLTLNPGDWMLSAWVQSIPNGATLTVDAATELVIGTTTASNSGSTVGYDRVTSNHALSTGVQHMLMIPAKHVLIAVPTTYFCNVLATYSAGTPQWVGTLSALRIR